MKMLRHLTLLAFTFSSIYLSAQVNENLLMERFNMKPELEKAHDRRCHSLVIQSHHLHFFSAAAPSFSFFGFLRITLIMADLRISLSLLSLFCFQVKSVTLPSKLFLTMQLSKKSTHFLQSGVSSNYKDLQYSIKPWNS